MGHGSTSPFTRGNPTVYISCALEITQQRVLGNPNTCRYFILEIRTLTTTSLSHINRSKSYVGYWPVYIFHWIIPIASFTATAKWCCDESDSLRKHSIHQTSKCLNIASLGTCNQGHRAGTHRAPCKVHLWGEGCIRCGFTSQAPTGVCRDLSHTSSHIGCVNKKILPWYHRTCKTVSTNH